MNNPADNSGSFSSGVPDHLKTAWQMVRYSMKIIFANKFPYFLFVAIAFFCFITILLVLDAEVYPTEGDIYGLIILPAIVMIFYPAIFNIQNEVDNKTLELLFGIPNYRYKVWLFRLGLIFTIEYLLIVGLLSLSYFALTPVPIFEMGAQLMFPVAFLATLAFMLSTLVKNGNGAAVTMIILGLLMIIITENINIYEYNILLNPYELPASLNESVWGEIVFYNRLYLAIGSVVNILAGLFWLQKREKFI